MKWPISQKNVTFCSRWIMVINRSKKAQGRKTLHYTRRRSFEEKETCIQKPVILCVTGIITDKDCIKFWWLSGENYSKQCVQINFCSGAHLAFPCVFEWEKLVFVFFLIGAWYTSFSRNLRKRSVARVYVPFRMVSTLSLQHYTLLPVQHILPSPHLSRYISLYPLGQYTAQNGALRDQ